MILPQDLHLARVLADGKTVEEEEDLHAERDGDRDDGWKVEVVQVIALVRDERASCLGHDDEVDGGHADDGQSDTRDIRRMTHRKPMVKNQHQIGAANHESTLTVNDVPRCL